MISPEHPAARILLEIEHTPAKRDGQAGFHGDREMEARLRSALPSRRTGWQGALHGGAVPWGLDVIAKAGNPAQAGIVPTGR